MPKKKSTFSLDFFLVLYSMGALVARYYLRYGAADLPEDGQPPKMTWAGTRLVDKLVMVAPPNAGSLKAFLALVNGIRPEILLPHYSSSVLGTMPSLYQLLPRGRHRALLDELGRPIQNIFEPSLWERNGWGLSNPTEDNVLKMLLPEIEDQETRRRIALEHQRKALLRGEQFARALDLPAKPSAATHLFLIAGDAVQTNKTARVDSEGQVTIIETAAGDGTVLRSSALMDERLSTDRTARLISPIPWEQVLFLSSDHRGLTEDPAFTDNILYFLLESPRKK